MSASDVPHEMIIAFIDHLHDDKPALKACSLVCKAWTRPTRFHLFSTVTVKWPLQPAVFPFVHRLCIDMSVAIADGAPIWDNIIPLLVGFDRIVSLNVALYWTSLHSQTWSTLSRNFSGTVSLSLLYFAFHDASSLTRVLCAFPRLRNLYMRGVLNPAAAEAFEVELPSALTFRLPVNLHTLDIGLLNLRPVLECFLSLSAPPALRNACLIGIEDGDLAALQKFIRIFGKGLESLILCAFLQDWPGPPHSIDLTPLSQLRSIKFVLGAGDGINRGRWITQILSRMSSAHLQVVQFRIHIPGVQGTDLDEISNSLEWQHVDAALQRTTFSRLKSVHFSCRLHSSVDSASDDSRLLSARMTVVQNLPQCHARGILRVDDVL